MGFESLAEGRHALLHWYGRLTAGVRASPVADDEISDDTLIVTERFKVVEGQ